MIRSSAPQSGRATRTATLLSTLAFAALSGPVIAGQLADIQVINRTTGQRLAVHEAHGKLYVAGNPGDRYSVRIVNKTPARVMAVVSVDGVNVVTGETAHPAQSGYVFWPRQTWDIAGWRKSRDEVAAFYFTTLPDSYAARTDRPANVGVIGVALFQEQLPPAARPAPPIATPAPTAPPSRRAETGAAEHARSGDASPVAREESTGAARGESSSGPTEERASRPGQMPADEAQPRQQNTMRERIGTGHGERERSVVSHTEFRRTTTMPVETLTIHYDRHENLVARGIIRAPAPVAEPRPFPGQPAFVPDPAG